MKKQNATKRNLFAELMEGVDAMKAQREGKVTLRTHAVAVPEVKASPGADFFVAAREKFNVSRAVWANMLRVSPRTVEKWEQGGQVGSLAATFVELVTQYPDTIERLQALPKRVSRPSRRVRRSDTRQNPAARSATTLRDTSERTDKRDSALRRSAKVG
ncbi:MAG: helix-turn-helix domain-containing protein [Terriglobia bacterium]